MREQWRIYDLIDKGGFKSKIRMRAHFLQGSPAHFLIEELLEVNEMQVV